MYSTKLCTDGEQMKYSIWDTIRRIFMVHGPVDFDYDYP